MDEWSGVPAGIDPNYSGYWSTTVAPWPMGNFIQITTNEEYGIIALDDQGNVWLYRQDKKAWLQFPTTRVPFIMEEDEEDDPK